MTHWQISKNHVDLQKLFDEYMDITIDLLHMDSDWDREFFLDLRENIQQAWVAQ